MDAAAVLCEQSGAVGRLPETVYHIGIVQCLHHLVISGAVASISICFTK